jgi:16S rRNA (cytosine1402-N4)-methyltransferase
MGPTELTIGHVKRDASISPTDHVPVLLAQVLDVLSPKPGQVIVDCTLGRGGHAAAIRARLGPARGNDGGASGSRLIGIDLDAANVAAARARLEHVPGGCCFDLFHTNFAGLPGVLAQAGVEDGRVDAILADVGVSSTQIDDPQRGFSYRRPGPLDMRMDPSRGQPASALVNRMSEGDLSAAFLDLGDETDAPKIARLIVERRTAAPITTTQDLMAIVCEARDFTIQRAAGAKLHPAARTFQALRILVNRELANLDRLLAVVPDALKPGGVAAVISFHSGEDRRVKYAFRDGLRAGVYAAANRDPITADVAEQRANPRSRSAKLRWARRASDV